MVVAVINSTPDVIDMLRIAFEQAGIVVVSALSHEIREGEVDIEAFVRQHGPRVVIYDIAPPYAANWRLFEHIRSLPAMIDRTFVLTSTNPERVRQLCGTTDTVYEIVEVPYELEQIVQVGREAMRGTTDNRPN